MSTRLSKSKKTVFLAGLFCLLITISIPLLKAQTEQKSYSYDSINVAIKINQNSTFDVEEKQVFDYQGAFHAGWRSIPLKKIDAVSDISVIDGEAGTPLIYSSSRLDKLNSSSWGKFTYFRENGNQNIEWYYNLADTKHEWILKFKVHGGIEFNKVSDRLYWNIFTDYTVPVKNSSVSVTLPVKVQTSDAPLFSYRANSSLALSNSFNENGSTFNFSGADFSPNEAFTIDANWPKGIVSQSAYWWDFLSIYSVIIFSVLIVLTGFLIGFIWWFKNEKIPKGRATIIAEYEPPEHLKPAMAEIITKEKLTNKGLTATIIDLAVRGYLRIEEDKSKDIGIKAWISMLVPLMFFVIFGIVFLTGILTNQKDLIPFGFLFIAGIIGLSLIKRVTTQFKNYTIYKNKEFINDPNLENYEKEYLQIILGPEGIFSTREMKKAGSSKQAEFSMLTRKLKDDIYKETEIDTKAFDVGVSEEKKEKVIWVALVMAALIFFGYIQNAINLQNQKWILLGIALATAIALWAFIKYEARLSEKGRILKDDWLGFKLYLETAEKYRMQNLTPDLFEKYLPYAMIFGVEKSWAKNFESMNLPFPSWYGSAGVYGSGISSGGGAGSFSPTGFSSSFTSAFSSAFASSGASGGGGGGGGAGGGGGGGGGGAS